MIYIPYYHGTRLGNWLFQYATARSVDSDVVWYIPQDSRAMRPHLFDDFFHIIPDLRITRKLPAHIHRFKETHSFSCPEIPAHRPLFLEGLFQNHHLLDKTLIQKILQCPKDIQEKIPPPTTEQQLFPFMFAEAIT